MVVWPESFIFLLSKDYVMKTGRILSVLVLCCVINLTAAALPPATPIHQLRIYTLPKENAVFFHERFKDHALRIMKKYNFNIVAIWQSELDGKLEFVYLLEWKDKESMEQAWKGFMADQEWKDIKKTTSALHGNYVDNIEDRTLLLTDYSPRQSLLK